MSPFIEKPEGFSSETLELLDNALTKLWLEQVAIGAAMSGKPMPAGLRASLDKTEMAGRSRRVRA